MTANKVSHNGCHAAVRDERELDPRHLVEHLRGQVHECAVAAVTDGEFLALHLCQGNDVSHGRALERRWCCENERRSGKSGHRDDVLSHLKCLCLESLTTAEYGCPSQTDDVTIGHRLCDCIDCDQAAGAR